MPARKRKACAFCGRDDQKITNEDALPRWIQNLFSREALVRLETDGRIVASWKSGQKNGPRINDVCESCNTSMSKLEDSVQPTLKPMITNGTTTHITMDNTRILTSWVYMTAMVFDLIRPNQSAPYFLPSERQRIVTEPMASILQDEGLNVWLAFYSGQSPWTIQQRKGTIATLTPKREPFDVYTFTISIGKVALQVLAFRVKGIVINDPAHAIWDNACIRIWPLAKNAYWPPAWRLKEPGFQAFRHRFKASD